MTLLAPATPLIQTLAALHSFPPSRLPCADSLPWLADHWSPATQASLNFYKEIQTQNVHFHGWKWGESRNRGGDTRTCMGFAHRLGDTHTHLFSQFTIGFLNSSVFLLSHHDSTYICDRGWQSQKRKAHLIWPMGCGGFLTCFSIAL